MRELLGGLVPGLPEAAVRAIVERADGVPLYAVETVRMLLADGKLVASDGAYRPVGDLATIAVPETLTELIAARLDALEPADRALLLDAAVLGQSFTTAALAAVSGIDEPDLEPRLRGLVRRELLAVEGNPRSPERGQYAFVQALVREVAYNTLAQARPEGPPPGRRPLLRDASGPTSSPAPSPATTSPPTGTRPGEPEADALAAQARIALRAAAERAAGLGSHAQAVAFLEQALSVTTDLPEQALLLERAGHSASLAADHDAAERYLVRAIEIQRGLGDRSAAARTIAALGASAHRRLALRPSAGDPRARRHGVRRPRRGPRGRRPRQPARPGALPRPAASAGGRGRRSSPGRGRAGRPRGARGRHAGHPRFRPVRSRPLLRRRRRDQDGDRPCPGEWTHGDHLRGACTT